MNMRSLIPSRRNTEVASPARYEETSPFLSLHRQMNRLFDDFFRDFDLPARGGWQASWPNVELEEGDKEYKVIAELPGLDDKDVNVELRQGVLTIKGEKREEKNGSRNGGRYSERFFGAFERSFDLGPDVDPDKVNAEFRKGMLTVTVGKRPDAQTQTKRIPVKAQG